MSSSAAFSAFLLSMVLWGCTLGGPALRYWQDGKIVVYATDVDYNATTLGFDFKPGILGLVDATVTDVGSNATHVIARQSPTNGPTAYFILTKGGDDEVPIVEGPLSRETFEKEAVSRSLPPFSWTSKNKKVLGSPWGFICPLSFISLFAFCVAKYFKGRRRALG